MPRFGSTIDVFGYWVEGIHQYVSLIAQLEDQVVSQEALFLGPSDIIKAVVMIPGSGEWVYDTDPVELLRTEPADADFLIFSFIGDGIVGISEGLANAYADGATADMIVSLNQIEETLPALENIALVVSWFATDTRAEFARIRPMTTNNLRAFKARSGFFGGFKDINRAYVDSRDQQNAYYVAGRRRYQIDEISRISTAPLGGGPELQNFTLSSSYSGTPSDRSIIKAIREINSRAKTTFYPFILVDVPPQVNKPDPHSDGSQPPFPWRGRITCFPAPGRPNTADGTAEARRQMEVLIGSARPEDFIPDPDKLTVRYVGSEDWTYRRMILHYAHLCALAGGVDTFLIGSELRGMTFVRDENGEHPFVRALVELADDVRAILPESLISYAADWSEMTPYQIPGGGLSFHLDDLWSNPNINAISIDNYWPLSDWRGGEGLDGQITDSIYNPTFLTRNVEAGEGYDFFYASDQDRIDQVRTPITDGLGKPWVYRYKDIRNWWNNFHFNRAADGTEAEVSTNWVPQSKPIWFTEIGCPAVTRGSNQPNVFVDPKSSESFFPYFSTGEVDERIQGRLISAMISYWAEGANNEISGSYGGVMVDTARIYVYCVDARPYPAFPDRLDVWNDGTNWPTGHWIIGRSRPTSIVPDPTLDTELIGIMPAKPMPRGEPAVNPDTGELNTAMHHYLAQIETLAKRVQNLQIVAIKGDGGGAG